ncbi:MAG TPA: TetR/AcrR family transcriptional regulator [Terriglobales bacterium]|nr:TetR/AcrR family transcriptional regulator [Terriglobales bacterium]
MATTTQMRVPARDRRLQIMEAAKELFAQQGFEGTTTRQIAGRARVNEAIIFRHFPSKEALYWAIIDHQCEVAGWQQSLRRHLSSGASEREVFAGIAEEILIRRAKDGSLSRLLLFSALENQRRSQRFFQTHVVEYYELIAEYIRRRIEEGAFRAVNPLLAARGFVGMVVYHSLIQEIYGAKRYQDFDVKEVSETLTDIWLGGMETGNAQNPRRKAK